MSSLPPLRRDRLFLGGLLALAFGVRLVYVLQSRASPCFDAPQLDAQYHVLWARALAEGRDFVQGPYIRAPLYPWFLGLCAKLDGTDLLLPRLVQAAFEALTALLTYLLARRLFDLRTARLGALFVALDWVLVFYDGELLAPTLIAPLTLGALLAAARARASGRGRDVLICGLCFGLATITRPSVLIFAPFLCLWLVRAGPSGSRLSIALLLTAGWLAPIAPVTVQNWRAGDAVLVTSVAGYNFWVGNNPEADGITAHAPGLRGDLVGGQADAARSAAREAGRELAPSEVSRHFFGKGLAWIGDHPGDALALFGRKLVYLWTDWEFANNLDPRFFAHRFAGVTKLLFVGFWLIGPLALLGWIVSMRSSRESAVVAGYLLIMGLGIAAFFVAARFRAPLLPVFSILAARGAWFLYDAARVKDVRRLAAGSLVLVAGVFLGRWQRPPVETSQANGLYMLGLTEAASGDYASARLQLEESVRAWPEFAYSQRALGELRHRAGDLPGALDAYIEASRLDPNDILASLGYANVLLRSERADEALRVVRNVLQSHPHHAEGLHALGRIHYMRAEFDAAVRSLREAKRAGAASPGLDFVLASSLFALGKGAEARGVVQDALARYPGDVNLLRLSKR